MDEPNRYPDAPAVRRRLTGPLLYFADRDARPGSAGAEFSAQFTRLPRSGPRQRHGRTIAHYVALATAGAQACRRTAKCLERKGVSGFLGKRADTRGGLSKGLGAFRIGRPLGVDNEGPGSSFQAPCQFFHNFCADAGRRCRRRFRAGREVGGTEQQAPAAAGRQSTLSMGCSTMRAGIRMVSPPWPVRWAACRVAHRKRR